MISWQEGNKNDMFIRSGEIALIASIEQVAQHIKSRLELFLGEFFLNRSAGTDWFGNVFTSPVNLNTIDLMIRNRIRNTPNVEAVTSLTLDYDQSQRRLLITFSAKAVDNVIEGQEVVINV